MRSLIFQAFTKLFLGIVLVGLLLFVPAGSFCYWQGWLFMTILFVPMTIAGCIMLSKNPQLLSSRLRAKETQSDQRTVIRLSSLMFIVGFIAAGLSYRFSFCMMPPALSYLGSALFIGAYLLYGQVLRENSFLSRTIEVQPDQPVIQTGLYGIVRHPMYAATLILFIAMPIILGSWIALIIFLAYPAIIVKRIIHEEAFLSENLAGYTEYMKTVRYRLIPHIW